MKAPYLTLTLGIVNITHTRVAGQFSLEAFHNKSVTSHPDSWHSEGHRLHRVVGQSPGPSHLHVPDIQHIARQEGQTLVQRLEVDGSIAKQVRGIL